MKYLIDSDWVADYLSRRQQAIQLIEDLLDYEPVGISLITYGEIYEGVYGSREPNISEARL